MSTLSTLSVWRQKLDAADKSRLFLNHFVIFINGDNFCNHFTSSHQSPNWSLTGGICWTRSSWLSCDRFCGTQRRRLTHHGIGAVQQAQHQQDEPPPLVHFEQRHFLRLGLRRLRNIGGSGDIRGDIAIVPHRRLRPVYRRDVSRRC